MGQVEDLARRNASHGTVICPSMVEQPVNNGSGDAPWKN
jgi:hypothetical protein